jgi:primosomal protein N' (replication factor Y)
MALLLFKGRDGHEVAATAGKCSEWLDACAAPQVEVLGPVEAPLARIRGSYRWHIILKSTSPPRLNALARETRARFGGKAGRRTGTTLEIDVDPVSML